MKVVISWLTFALLAASIHGQDTTRRLDVNEDATPAPSESSYPSVKPSAEPSLSLEPSTSSQPSLPKIECSEDNVLFPFCYNGQGSGLGTGFNQFGYSACTVIDSSEFCGTYAFGVADQVFTTDQDIAFRCGDVWEWFNRCIADSFPTCRVLFEGVFRGYTPRLMEKYQKGNEWEVKVESYYGADCNSNCNEGANRWRCKDEDEAEGILEFARWVAGYREGDTEGNPSSPDLYEIPATGCDTAAPSESLVPTESPAPTEIPTPLCSESGYPPYVTPPKGNWVTKKTIGSGGPTILVQRSCTFEIISDGVSEFFDEPLPWLIRSAELMPDYSSFEITTPGDFTGEPMDLNAFETEGNVVYLNSGQDNAGFTGTLRFEFASSNTATTWSNFWNERINDHPAIWQTVPDDKLFCGSGPFCYDGFPRIRCSIDTPSNFCGDFDFILSPADGVEAPVERTSDVFEWFRTCIETAYVYDGGPCTINPKFNASTFLYNDSVQDFRFGGSGTKPYRFNFRTLIPNPFEEFRVQYVCPPGVEGLQQVEAMEEFFEMVENGIGFGPSASELFLEEPWECTDSPTMTPTVCAVEDSFFNNPPLYIGLVLDISYSTYRDDFGGTDVGDQNGDGKADTILDASIKAAKALLETVLETENLDNSNTNIGVIVFDTIGEYKGHFNPLNEDGTAINPQLLTMLESLQTVTTEEEIRRTNRGWTNMDDGLDSAIEYFGDDTRPEFTNPTSLMVFLSDGKPTVMGDGDGESFCDTERADCAGATLSTTVTCTNPTTNFECDSDPLKFCVLGSGEDTCEDQSVTKSFGSELAALEGVTRIAIGVGINSDVGEGSALAEIDNDPIRIGFGLPPRQVLDADDLIQALRDLCPETTPAPTDTPSSLPSAEPTPNPTAGPTTAPTTGPTVGPTPSPSVDICVYTTIDFLDIAGTVNQPGTPLFPIDYEEYGVAFLATTSGSDTAQQAYFFDSEDSAAGTVLIVPDQSDPKQMSPDGGDITIILSGVQDKNMILDLWNVTLGVSITTWDSEDVIIECMTYAEQLGIQEISVSVISVRKITISFLAQGALAEVKTCSDPNRTPAPQGFSPPSGGSFTHEPTSSPTSGPTAGPTSGPTSPTSSPSDSPSGSFFPSSAPTSSPTIGPTSGPTGSPTAGPTSDPTAGPTAGPTGAPSGVPTSGPTGFPTAGPTSGPTSTPSAEPTQDPTGSPTSGPTSGPSIDICDYYNLDFETDSEGEPTVSGEPLFPIEYEDYGLSILTKPFNELGLVLDDTPVQGQFLQSENEEAGMVIMVPSSNETEIMNPYGGNIEITLSGILTKNLRIDLWDIDAGAGIKTLNDEGIIMDQNYTGAADGIVEISVEVILVKKIIISFYGTGGLAELKTCRDPGATPAPQGFSPPSGGEFTHNPTIGPTDEPSASPTSSPSDSPSGSFFPSAVPTSGPTAGPTSDPTAGSTAGPTGDPTASPTVGPTSDPTPGPTPTPTPGIPPCPPDLVLSVVSPDGGTPFDNIPLKIVEQNASTVKLQLLKPFFETTKFTYIEYIGKHEQQCVGYELFEGTEVEVVVAECMEHVPVSVVNVYVVDDELVEGDAEIPKCCHHPDVDFNVVKYTFEVWCVTKCVPEEYTEFTD